MNAPRGAIRNANYRQQIADFTGLRWGNITPTDLDGFLDFGDRLFVFIEGKHGMAQIQYGQKLAMERLVDACASETRASIGFIVRHKTPPDAEIDYANALVAEFRWRQKWNPPAGDIKLREAVERMRRMTLKEAVNEIDEWVADYDREWARLQAEMNGGSA
jgi:hypothetical protein